MKLILNLCTGILGVYLAVVAGNIIGRIVKSLCALCTKQAHAFGTFSDIFLIRSPEDPRNTKYVVALIAILVIGAGNEAARHIFASNQIGAFYERSEYTENYEGFIYSDSNSYQIPIIASIHHSTSSEDTPEETVHLSDDYFIHHLWLPYHIQQDTEGTYNGDAGKGLVFLTDQTCAIELTKIATEDSFKHLNETAISANGDIVASKYGDTYHFDDCRYVKNISRNNLIRFHNTQEAEIFGFSPCTICPF